MDFRRGKPALHSGVWVIFWPAFSVFFFSALTEMLKNRSLRKNGSVLGETIFDDGAAILYDQTEKRYHLIAVKAGTILVDERLCADRLLGRMRFTCAHELGHWVLHQKLYSGTGDVAAYEGKTSSDESHGLIERQAYGFLTIFLGLLKRRRKLRSYVYKPLAQL